MTIPKYEIIIDGKKIDVSKRLNKLTITEKRDQLSDYATLNISDHDDKIALPRRGVKMKISLGFSGQAYHDKGIFIVDEISYATAPNIIAISGRSVNFGDSFKIKETRSWHKKKLSDIVKTIAGKHGLKARIGAELEKHTYDHIDQNNESDGAFLKRLCKDINAAMACKSGYLIIAEKSNGKSMSGKLMPTVTIKRAECEKLSFKVSDRKSGYTGVQCAYYDHWNGKGGFVVTGDKALLKKIPKHLANKQLAQAAADAELKKLKRLRNGEITVSLAVGNPSLTPEMNIILEGFKDEISNQKWIIDEVKHICGGKGLITTLILEAQNQ
jgi:phage protein D